MKNKIADKKYFFSFLTCGLLLPALLYSGEYKSEYKLSVVVGPAGPWGESAVEFSEIVRTKTGGRINIKPYYSGQLFSGKQTNEFLLLKQGVADFAIGSTINWSTTIKELNLFSLPFLFPDYKSLDEVEGSAVGKKVFEIFDTKGVKPLAWGENGFRELTNCKKSIETPEDMRGLKIRVVGSPIFIDILKSLEANPVSMNWSEAITGFNQGTVDGQENPVVSVILPNKIWQYHKYITFWHYVIDPLIFAMNRKEWEKLTKEDKKIISESALEVMGRQKTGARKGLAGETDKSGLIKELEENGMKVKVLSREETRLFKDKTKSVYAKWEKLIGKELIEQTEKIIFGKDK